MNIWTENYMDTKYQTSASWYNQFKQPEWCWTRLVNLKMLSL